MVRHRNSESNLQVNTALTCLPVQGLGELVDAWWHLQPLHEDSPLPLEADVLGPSHEPAQVTLGLDVLACNKSFILVS